MRLFFKTSLASFLVLCAPTVAGAQRTQSFDEFNKQRQEKFDKYKEQKQKDFEEFRRKRNEEFAKFLRKAWKDADPSPVIPQPKEDPVPPVVRPKEDVSPEPPAPKPLPFEEVVPAPVPVPQPTPIDPIEEIPVEPIDPTPKVQPSQDFSFFGTQGKVRFDAADKIHLSALNENTIADAWLKLSEPAYTNLIYDCLKLREDLRLCDWAYLVMLQNMAESIYGKNTDEAVLLMAYVYCQSGYKMRLAIGDGKLWMMFASDHKIYNWNYYKINGQDFYTYNNRTGEIRICQQEYPKERSMSLLIAEQPAFNVRMTTESVHRSTRNPEISVSIKANKNMLDFYSTYPTSMIGENLVSRWAMYANMPMPEIVKTQVYPQLKKAIEGYDQLTAVNRILNWVQTGFEYEYDDKIWGCDRAFFPEESLHYPYCDCEDRSILLTRIIRDLLGLKCILIYYPGHLAAAVEITKGNPSGDYIELNGRKFFISDGTIMGYGASVGETMDGMSNKEAKVILLD